MAKNPSIIGGRDTFKHVGYLQCASTRCYRFGGEIGVFGIGAGALVGVLVLTGALVGTLVGAGFSVLLVSAVGVLLFIAALGAANILLAKVVTVSSPVIPRVGWVK